jgi:hypothetical protein
LNDLKYIKNKCNNKKYDEIKKEIIDLSNKIEKK